MYRTDICVNPPLSPPPPKKKKKTKRQKRLLEHYKMHDI